MSLPTWLKLATVGGSAERLAQDKSASAVIAALVPICVSLRRFAVETGKHQTRKAA